MSIVDLHLHTTASDGRLTPTQLIQLVAHRGLETVAITDHDTTQGLPEAFQAAKAFPKLRLIPGIELSTDIPSGEMHLLGYFIDLNHQEFQNIMARNREGRVGRAKEMVRKLRAMGVIIDWERVSQLAGDGAVGRPHIALAMVEKGYIKNPQDAFVNYIENGGPAYAEREKMTPSKSLRLIRDAGGVPVLAHPTYLTGFESILDELKEDGLAGIEVYYAKYSPDTIAGLAALASRHGLIPCGGSDYHAMGNPNEPLPGKVGPPPKSVEQLASLQAIPEDQRR
jgi:predicted metal-dependent phosphoesterase TrpH